MFPVAMALMGAGTLLSAYGTFGQLTAQKAGLGYTAQIESLNAQASDWAAEDALRRGELAASDQRRKTAAVRGAQIAAFAARGLSLESGSPLSILEDTMYFGDLDEATIKSNAQRESYGLKMQAVGYRSKAALARFEASNINPRFSAMAGLLSGAGQIAGTWYAAKGGGTTGVPSGTVSVGTARMGQ